MNSTTIAKFSVTLFMVILLGVNAGYAGKCEKNGEKDGIDNLKIVDWTVFVFSLITIGALMFSMKNGGYKMDIATVISLFVNTIMLLLNGLMIQFCPDGHWGWLVVVDWIVFSIGLILCGFLGYNGFK